MRRILCESHLLGRRSEGGDGELVEMSDKGSGAEAMYSETDRLCFGVDDESHYTRMMRRARDFVRRHNPSLMPTLNAILRNRSDRRESIFELAKRLKAGKRTAEKRYYRSRARLLRLFGA